MNAEERLIEIKTRQNELLGKCFDYFYWFARLEFAMKENRFVKAGRYGEALPNWGALIDDLSKDYEITKEAALLLNAPPKTQIFEDDICDWKPTRLDREETKLGKVVLVVKTIRNNLFHGGKSGQKDWDDPERNLFLLTNGKAVLDSLAHIAGLEADYERRY